MKMSRLQSQSGFTLIELVIVIGLIAILVTFSSIGFDMIYSHQLTSAKAQLMSDLTKLRVDAVSISSTPTSRGFGLRFVSPTTYRVFEFDDLDGNFTYKADHSETIVKPDTVFGSGIEVTIGDSGPATDNIRIYDNRGILRTQSWSSVGNQTYVIRHPKVNQVRCIVIDTVIMREGAWDGSNCN